MCSVCPQVMTKAVVGPTHYRHKRKIQEIWWRVLSKGHNSDKNLGYIALVTSKQAVAWFPWIWQSHLWYKNWKICLKYYLSFEDKCFVECHYFSWCNPGFSWTVMLRLWSVPGQGFPAELCRESHEVLMKLWHMSICCHCWRMLQTRRYACGTDINPKRSKI